MRSEYDVYCPIRHRYSSRLEDAACWWPWTTVTKYIHKPNHLFGLSLPLSCPFCDVECPCLQPSVLSGKLPPSRLLLRAQGWGTWPDMNKKFLSIKFPAVSNCLFLHMVSNYPGVKFSSVKLSGVKLSAVSNCPVSECPIIANQTRSIICGFMFDWDLRQDAILESVLHDCLASELWSVPPQNLPT